MNRLDLAYLHRDPHPILVSPAREIERRAAWGALKEDAKFIGAVLLATAVIVALIAGVFLV
jgi:hypothetical protein